MSIVFRIDIFCNDEKDISSCHHALCCGAYGVICCNDFSNWTDRKLSLSSVLNQRCPLEVINRFCVLTERHAPNSSTCCLIYTGKYMCCGTAAGNCCSDYYHSCDSGYVRNTWVPICVPSPRYERCSGQDEKSLANLPAHSAILMQWYSWTTATAMVASS